MKKLTLIFFVFVIPFTFSHAQRNLQVKEKTEALSVFTDKDTSIDGSAGQAGATISCPLTLSLTFSSNVDSKVDVYQTEEKGGLRYYYLRFIVGRYRGASYDNRILEVMASGFLPLKFPLSLQPSESKSFEVFDPNATVGVGCFYQFFNEAAELYRQAFYIEAQEKYKLSMECTDAPANVNVKERIADIDTILIIRVKADEAFELQNYRIAMESYQKIFSLNNEDQHAGSRLSESRLKYLEFCDTYFRNAEDFFASGKYDKAKQLYETILAQSCPKITEAGVRLVDIRNIEASRSQRAQVINYEFAQNAPIGLSVGRYREDKVRAYFSLRLNTQIFEAMRGEQTEKNPELDVSAGANIMAFKPVWVFAGLGFTGVGDWVSEDPDDDDSFFLRSALSPEIGVLGKLGPVVLRYTFQYRFALDKNFQEHIGKLQHVFGIGICF